MKRKTRFSSAERREVLRLHEAGHTVTDISSKLGRTQEATLRQLQWQLIGLGHDSPRRNTKGHMWTSEEVDQLMRLRDDEDLDFTAIGARMELARSVVKSEYYRSNAKLRPSESSLQEISIAVDVK